MAKKTRSKSTGRGKKKSKPAKKKAKAAKKKTTARTPRRASIGDRLSSAYRTVVDTVKGTDRLRNKMEPPGTSETE